MISKGKRLIILFLTVIIASVSLTLPSSAADLRGSYGYGRSELSKMTNSRVYLLAYDRIVKGVEAYSMSISLYDRDHLLSVSELRMVYNAYLNDNPHHFWVSGSYRYEYDSDNKILSVGPVYTMDKDDVFAARVTFEKTVSSYISDINLNSSQYEIQKKIHDRICKNVVYSSDSANAHNAYGALVEGRAVCDGYAKAYQYLLFRCKINAHMVSGVATDSRGQRSNHAWLLVYIDGSYYHSDITWDDQDDDIFYGYMNLPDSEISRDHTLINPGYPIPSCSSKRADYFTVEDAYFDSFSADRLAGLLNNPFYKANIRVGSIDEFRRWFNAGTLSQLAKKLEISSFDAKYTYSSFGEVCITMNTKTPNSLSGTIRSFALDDEPITVSLCLPRSTEPFRTVTVTGRNAEYSLDNIQNGEYTLIISKRNHLPYSKKVRVLGKSSFDVKLEVFGDVNNDDSVDELDSVLLSRFLAGWNVNVDMIKADLNLSMSVTESDAVMLGRFLAGWDVTFG